MIAPSPAGTKVEVLPSLLSATVLALLLALLPLTRPHAGDPAWLLWLAGAGSGALVFAPALIGARALKGSRAAVIDAALGIAIAAGPLMLLGRLIKTGTHNRPLGAMTYAVLGCLGVLCAWAVAWRLAAYGRSGRNPLVRNAGKLGLGVLVLASAALTLAPLSTGGAIVGPVVLDGTLVVLSLALLVRREFDAPLRRVPDWVAWGLYLAVVAVGIIASARLNQSLATSSVPLSLLSALFAS